MEFHDLTAVITGGSSGIGLATAKALAARGANVWLVARSLPRLETALCEVRAVQKEDRQCSGIIQADVSNQEQASQAAAEIYRVAGKIDLLINSAGVAHPGNFQDLDPSIFHWMMDVNYFGTVNMTRAVIPGMIQRGHGQIVNISSIAGFIGVWGYTAYGASKYAVRGFSDALRAELKPHGIQVYLVFPPDTDTPQLRYENQFKPGETRALAGNTGILPAEAVAGSILKGIQKKRYVILPGLETRLLYRLSALFGDNVYWIIDLLIQKYRQKTNLPQTGGK